MYIIYKPQCNTKYNIGFECKYLYYTHSNRATPMTRGVIGEDSLESLKRKVSQKS